MGDDSLMKMCQRYSVMTSQPSQTGIKFRQKIKHSHYSLLAEQQEDYRQTLNESRRIAQTVSMSTQTGDNVQRSKIDWPKLISSLKTNGDMNSDEQKALLAVLRINILARSDSLSRKHRGQLWLKLFDIE